MNIQKEKLQSSFILLALVCSFFSITAGATAPALAESAQPAWPTEATQIGTNQALNPVWGTAQNSDISWTYDTKGDVPFTNVIVVDGLAYAGTMMNHIIALDAVTGKLAWQFEADNWIMTNPVVANGKLFAGSGGRYYLPGQKPSKGAIRGTGSNSLYALDAKTGELIWRYQIPGEAMPTPLYADGVVYFVTGDRALYALNADTGTLLYKKELGSVFSMGSINRDGDILVFGGGFPFKVFGFNLKTGQVAWETPLNEVYLGLDDSNPAISNGLLYINGIAYDPPAPEKGQPNPTNPHHVFYALETQTGKLRWTFNAGMYALVDDNKASTPAIVDGVYYGASSESRQFFALDAATGALKWQYNIGVPVKGGPVVQDGYVFFADAKGNVYALEAATGKLVNKKALGGNVNPQGPTIYNGTLYVANQNGKIYAIPVASLLKTRLQAAQPRSATLPQHSQYFAPTGHSVSGAFLDYWQSQGGLSQFGYPITGEFQEYHSQEGQTYTVQYFERARLELHGTQVLLGRLGSEYTAANPPDRQAFRPVSAPTNTTGYFAATGHTILPDFYSYWQNNGGLARYGYPISQPFQAVSSDGKTYITQYFERDRFELHPGPNGNQVLLGLIGRERLNAL
ncbi:MAG TPA: PQQ-binding-like beta-propeller repeat protein [Chloroflexia bacterium]|nr:PQQ-binding-like beta-propeller repeat protein [Chloroflexia bacterium]